MNDQKITIKFILTGIIAVLITWFIHEFAHWLTSELLGYKTIMRLNGTSPESGENPTVLHHMVISASGPIVTVLQALIVFLWLKSRNWNKNVYLFLFTALYMRFLAGIMNFVNPNDEGRISSFLGIGLFTLPLIVSGVLFFMVYNISIKYNLNIKFQFWTLILIMAASSILILWDQFFGIRIL